MDEKICFLSMARPDYPRECTSRCTAFVGNEKDPVTWKSCRLLRSADALTQAADTLREVDKSRFQPPPPGVR